ncbi:MAG: phosphoribosyltransferase [Parcubacteria group bacterium Athens0714_24]|nr:MAG: phosphoribosyltransferase [Parcubacteria group bacterium Athens0714_24]
MGFFFPQKCIGCGNKNDILCRKCIDKIDKPTFLELNNVFAASDYNDILVKKAIWLLKYRGIRETAEPLAELIKIRLLEKIKDKETAFIPIPLSAKRMKERCFNQTELIAKHISDNVITNVLYKMKETPSQVALKDRRKRLQNIKGSFGVKNAELIINKNIILIDDVSTTGATMAEAKKILKNAGAKNVIGLVVARG